MISNILQANLIIFLNEKMWFIGSFKLIKTEGEVESHDVCFWPSPSSLRVPRSKKPDFSNLFLFLLKTIFKITLFIYLLYVYVYEREAERDRDTHTHTHRGETDRHRGGERE